MDADDHSELFKYVLPQAWQAWQDFAPKPGSVIYHYTTPDALISILSSRRMWATNLLFTNDPSELVYAESVITECLDEVIADCSAKSDTNRCKWLDGFKLTTRRQRERNDWYSVSFCGSGDLLPQWRTYGALGGGLAMGWSTGSELPELPVRVGIEYDSSRQKQMVRDIIRHHLAHVEAFVDITKPEARVALEHATGSLGVFFSVFLYSFKHEAFEQEREFRFVYPAFGSHLPEGKELLFRRFDSIVKPYIEVDFGAAELREIVYGPTGNSALTERWLRLALDSAGLERVTIRRSAIPMR